MKHPFTDEDIDAAIGEADSWHYDMSDEVMDTILQAAWDSAVKRGAVDEDEFDGDEFYTIMKPEEKDND